MERNSLAVGGVDPSGGGSLVSQSDFCDIPVSCRREDSEGSSGQEGSGLDSDVEGAIYAQMFFRDSTEKRKKRRRRGPSRLGGCEIEIPNALGSPDDCMSVSLVMADDRRQRKKRRQGRSRLKGGTGLGSTQEDTGGRGGEGGREEEDEEKGSSDVEESRCNAVRKTTQPFKICRDAPLANQNAQRKRSWAMDVTDGRKKSNGAAVLNPGEKPGRSDRIPSPSVAVVRRGDPPPNHRGSALSPDVIVIGSSSEEAESSDLCEVVSGYNQTDSDVIIISDPEKEKRERRFGREVGGVGDRGREGRGGGGGSVKVINSSLGKTVVHKLSSVDESLSSDTEGHPRKLEVENEEEDEEEGEGIRSGYSSSEEGSSLSEGECSSDMELCSPEEGEGPDGPWQLHKKDLVGREAYERMTGQRVGRYYGSRFKKCSNCKQKGHMNKECPQPKRHLTCYLCGEVDHVSSTCQQDLCSYCYNLKHRGRSCAPPWASPRTHCTRCYMTGHHASICTDLWRQFHNTTHKDQFLQKLAPHEQRQSKSVFCYNCGQGGHFGFECTKMRPRGNPLPHFNLVAQYDNNCWAPGGAKGRNRFPERSRFHEERSGRNNPIGTKRSALYSPEMPASKRPLLDEHFSEPRRGDAPRGHPRRRQPWSRDSHPGVNRRYSEPIHHHSPEDRRVEVGRDRLSVTISTSYGQLTTVSPFADTRTPLLSPPPLPGPQYVPPPGRSSSSPLFPPLPHYHPPPPPPPPPPHPRQRALPNHRHNPRQRTSISDSDFPRTPFPQPKFPVTNSHQGQYPFADDPPPPHSRKNNRRSSDTSDQRSLLGEYMGRPGRSLMRSESYGGQEVNARGFRVSGDTVRTMNSVTHGRNRRRY